ncbi:hypothetical protein [Flavobacterium sp. 7E]|uniref:hypothetical protein n=1 Tax=Flavobacterium sp. 7E TaxID=2735898 RepID=UPI001C2CEE4A|nr:hypothetical protein [Flavobacterium sp. 7E]
MKFSLMTFGQNKQTIQNDKEFNSVFSKVDSGLFSGTVNGVLFLNDGDREIILDFQGSKAYLTLEKDADEVYDVSTKIYHGKTTSGKSSIEYKTYAHANYLVINIATENYQVGIIDGACDEIINGIEYFYKSEKNTEYLILKVKKELLLTNYYSLPKNKNNDPNKIDNIKKKEKLIKLLPNSTIVYAIKRIN